MNKNLTIEDLEERRKKLVKEIRAALESFSEETEIVPEVKIQCNALGLYLGIVSYKVQVSVKL